MMKLSVQRGRMQWLAASLLVAVMAFAEYPGTKWESSPHAVKAKYPNLMRQRCCYFEGANAFGQDSLEVHSEWIDNGRYERRTFSFLKKKLVCVENRCRLDSLNQDNFEQQIVEPLRKIYGSKKHFSTLQENKTHKNTYYIWRTKTDVVVAMYGHFKKLTPDNLDWAKISYYKKEFYDLKNQGKLSLAGEGDLQVFY